MKPFVHILIVFVLCITVVSLLLPKNIYLNETESRIYNTYHELSGDGLVTYHATGVAPVVFNHKVRYLVDFDIHKSYPENYNFLFSLNRGKLFLSESLENDIDLDVGSFSCHEDKQKSDSHLKYYCAQFVINDHGEKSDTITVEFCWDIREDLLNEDTNN